MVSIATSTNPIAASSASGNHGSRSSACGAFAGWFDGVVVTRWSMSLTVGADRGRLRGSARPRLGGASLTARMWSSMGT